MAQSADDSFTRNARALWRFGWLIVIGACIAALVPMLMLYKPKWPPTPRTRPSYVAKTQILVDSPTGPFLRTQPKIVGQSQGRNDTPPSKNPVVPSVSDTRSLVEAANLFPLLVTSDEVAAIREKRVGVIRGTVTAKALFASQGVNRYRPGSVPVMEITAVARHPKPALRLATGTATAFEIWLADRQEQSNIPPNQRIVLRPIQAAAVAKTGSAGKGLPMLVGLAILAAFIGLAIALDRARPRTNASRRAPRPVGEVPPTPSELQPSDEEPFGVVAVHPPPNPQR
jgi:hypothetical protein